MPLTYTSIKSRRLVQFQTRMGTGESWANAAGVRYVSYRPQTDIAYDYDLITTTGNMKLYKTIGAGRGYGRGFRGVVWTEDFELAEALVAYSHLNSHVNAVIDVATQLGILMKINTGLNTNNFRYMTKVVQPVIFGFGYGVSDYAKTLMQADSGLRNLIPVPFQLMINASNTHFNTTNASAAGVHTSFSNT